MLGVYEDYSAKAVHVFYAEESDINKTISWQPGRDKDFASLKELVTTAKSRIHLPAEYHIDSLHSIEWKHFDYGWLLEINFYCLPNSKMIRDGDFIVTIRMLPSGAPVTDRSRKMTSDELQGASPSELKK